MDNWLLEDVEFLLMTGVSPERTGRLTIDAARNTDSWETLAHGRVQVGGLLQLLVDIVTRDVLVVEPRFRKAWGSGGSPLARLAEQNVVDVTLVDTSTPEAKSIQRGTLASICTTDQLRAMQAENEKAWAESSEVPYPYMSQIVWGAAGYLVRSHLLAIPYSGHPIRKHLLGQTTFRSTSPDAVGATLSWIEAQRKTVFASVTPAGDAQRWGVVLPPLAIEVIEAATSAEDLIPVALQLRDRYAEFRRWMGLYQNAIEAEDPKRLLDFQQTFASVGRTIGAKHGSADYGQTSLAISFQFLGISVPVPMVADRIRQRFGVRATLDRLVFARRGKGSLEKLLGMLGEKRTTLGREIVDSLLHSPG